MNKNNKKGRRLNVTKIWIAVAVVAVICVGGWLIYRHYHDNSINNQIDTPLSDCSTVLPNPNSKVKSFVAAYQNGRASTLQVQVECGNAMDGFVTSYSLTTANKQIMDSQYTYADASPPGPTTEHNCKMVSISSSRALVSCDGSTFNLY